MSGSTTKYIERVAYFVMGRRYSHPRFIDASFRILWSHLYGTLYRVKIDWLVRGERVNVVTRHEIPRENEFNEWQA